ncbi:MAG: hypothetical protein ABR556_10345 [Pyrinomonadaceae bacterium]
MTNHRASMTNHKAGKAILILVYALAVVCCAPLQPPSATVPRANEPPYPVLLKEDIRRKDSAILAVDKLLPQSGDPRARDFELQPITSTIQSLPATSSTPLLLPKIGGAAVMNEEEIRESLRRFIKNWQQLIGSDPAKLSLVERLDQPDGSKLANYEQRPFRYPIRGGYGKLQIRFTPGRHVINISSTCIPDADRIQTALAAVSVRLNVEDAIKQLHDNDIIYRGANGNTLSFRLPATSEETPRGLVVYIRPSNDRPDALDIHLAWEIELSNAPIKTAYVDAVNGAILPPAV